MEAPSPPSLYIINKCLELLASNKKSRDEALNGHLAQVMQAVVEDPGLLNIVALHMSGQFTARRIYELGTSQERRWMERKAPSIHRPELRDLEKFKATLVREELELPRIENSVPAPQPLTDTPTSRTWQ